MTLEEAIKHCDEVANEKYIQGMLCHANPNDKHLDNCIECANQHEQLKEWLMELKDLKNPQPYKFEELGKGRAFFDDILEVQAIIIDIDYESKRIISAYWLDKNNCLVTYDVEFEEGRFYPITKALEYQGKEDAK